MSLYIFVVSPDKLKIISEMTYKNDRFYHSSGEIMPTNPRVKYHRVKDSDGYVDAQVKCYFLMLKTKLC